jgi:hypothetical protein
VAFLFTFSAIGKSKIRLIRQENSKKVEREKGKGRPEERRRETGKRRPEERRRETGKRRREKWESVMR